MESQLNDRLAAAAPSVVDRTDEVRRELHQLVAATEAAAAPTRRRFTRSRGFAAFGAAVAVGLGLTASATGGVHTPWGSIAAQKFSYPGPSIHAEDMTQGSNCKVVYGAAGTWDPKHPVSPEERAQVLEHAREFIRDIDLSTISVPDAIRRYEAEHARLARSTGLDLPASVFRPDGTPDDIKAFAVLAALDQRLRAELKGKGLSTHAVGAVAMPECETVLPPDQWSEADHS